MLGKIHLPNHDALTSATAVVATQQRAANGWKVLCLSLRGSFTSKLTPTAD